MCDNERSSDMHILSTRHNPQTQIRVANIQNTAVTPRAWSLHSGHHQRPDTTRIASRNIRTRCHSLHRQRRLTVGVPAQERSVGRPSRNRLENGHANHHRYRITTPVLKMHLDRAATRISTYSVLAGRRWPPARQSQCRSRVARLACASSLRPTRYHRCGTADTPCRPKLNAIRRPGCTS